MTRNAVYLCGPIRNCAYAQTTGWRNLAGALLSQRDIDVWDPMRGKTENTIHSAHDDITSDAAVVSRDLGDISASNALLIHVGYRSLLPPAMTGTIVEVFYAHSQFGYPLPCVAFIMSGEQVNPQFYSPWFGQFVIPRYRVQHGLENAIAFLVGLL